MKYEKSHPWITFKLNLKGVGSRFWLQMGEISSKCEHLAGVPLSPSFAEELNRIFLAKGVLATTAIEGNTLSEEQVLQQVQGELELPESQDYLKQEAQNIIDLCNDEVRVQTQEPETERVLSPELIKYYNECVLKGLEVEEGVVPGKYREHSVVVGNVYKGAPAEDCEYLMDELMKWLNSDDFEPPEKDLAVPYAFLKAIVGHVYLAWIHPFGDGNGRAARMLEFHTLFASGVPLPAAHLLSDHYNHTRTRYYRELDKASKSGGDLVPFFQYALQGFLDGIRGQIKLVRAHQMAITWQTYVYQQFKDKKLTVAQKRRRDLVLELSQHSWVKVADVPDLSPSTARAYDEAGDRMLQRDLNAVAKLGLITRHRGKVLANKHIMAAFRPTKVEK